MIQLTNKIRFIHNSGDTYSYHPRFTVAYHRDADRIVFAWTEVYHKDNYDKAIGRQVSTNRLIQNLEDLMGETHAGIDDKTKTGVIFIADILPLVSDILAHTVLNNLDLMSFKHSFISGVISTFIQEEMKNQGY